LLAKQQQETPAARARAKDRSGGSGKSLGLVFGPVRLQRPIVHVRHSPVPDVKIPRSNVNKAEAVHSKADLIKLHRSRMGRKLQ
jgi:hypothetical protein